MNHNDPTGRELRVTAMERETIRRFYGRENITFTSVGWPWARTYQVSVTEAGYRHMARYIRESDGNAEYAERLNRAIVNPLYRYPSLSSVRTGEGREWIGQEFEGMRVPNTSGRGSYAQVISSPEDSTGMANVRGIIFPITRYDLTSQYQQRAVADMIFANILDIALIAIAVVTPWPGDEEAAVGRLILNVGGTGEEVAEASAADVVIHLNNLEDLSRSAANIIPDLYIGAAESMPFESSTFDFINANRLPSTINFRDFAIESIRVIKAGGKFRIHIQFGPEDVVEEAVAAFRNAGFEDVLSQPGGIITGVSP